MAGAIASRCEIVIDSGGFFPRLELMLLEAFPGPSH
jgi:hypothetical protein